MRFTVVAGTRAELVKLGPVIHALRSVQADVQLCLTGEETRASLEPMLSLFQIKAELELPPVAEGRLETKPVARLAQLLTGFNSLHDQLDGDGLIIQGDSAAAFAAAYFAFNRRIPVAHVDAGIRTNDLAAPFPEEANRQMLARIVANHFAATTSSVRQLLREGIPRERIHLVGNTGVDSLLYVQNLIAKGGETLEAKLPLKLRQWLAEAPAGLVVIEKAANQGLRLERHLVNLIRLLERYPSLRLLIPLDPNPEIGPIIKDFLGEHPRALLTGPLPYVAMVYVMSKTKFAITDAGSVQIAAPSLGLPVMLISESAEMPEGIDAGVAKLVDTDREKLFAGCEQALAAADLQKQANPFGDGLSARRVARKLTGFSSDREKRLKIAVRNSGMRVGTRRARAQLRLVTSEPAPAHDSTKTESPPPQP